MSSVDLEEGRLSRNMIVFWSIVAIRLEPSVVTSLLLNSRNARIDPNAHSLTWVRKLISRIPRWAILSFVSGLGNAFFHRRRSCARWIFTKLGPSGISPPIRTHATWTCVADTLSSEELLLFNRSVAKESTRE